MQKLFLLFFFGCSISLFCSDVKAADFDTKKDSEVPVRLLPIVSSVISPVISPYTFNRGDVSRWQALRAYYPLYSDVMLQAVAAQIHANIGVTAADLQAQITDLQAETQVLDAQIIDPAIIEKNKDSHVREVLHEQNLQLGQRYALLSAKLDALRLMLAQVSKRSS